MVYAVNIGDFITLAKSDAALRFVIGPLIDPSAVIEVERGRIDGFGAILDCSEERASAIIEIVRKRRKKYQFRFYQSETGEGSWVRV
jgi:hypothetical protein